MSNDIGKGPIEEEVEGETTNLYTTATAYVLESIRRAGKNKRLDVKRGEGLVKGMIDSIVNSSALLLLATDRRQEFAVNTHSVNVAILSLRLAQTLNYNLQDQIKVGLAALLHEIGVARLPERMLYQPRPSRSDSRKRPVHGAKILEQLSPAYDWLAKTVGQVYERENGSGFPLGLKGEDIREEAKILGIVDVFEACLHNRPYRKAVTGYQLLGELTRDQTKTFSDHMVKALVRSFSLYPYNEYVLLNSDELGQVVEVNPGQLSRPLIKILYDREGRRLAEPRETDLAEYPSLFITKVITYDMLPTAVSGSIQ